MKSYSAGGNLMEVVLILDYKQQFKVFEMSYSCTASD